MNFKDLVTKSGSLTMEQVVKLRNLFADSDERSSDADVARRIHDRFGTSVEQFNATCRWT